jgi:hypothetical protein
MAKRILKLTEEDLIAFLEPSLRASGWMADDLNIVGFTYSTRKLRKGGDFYKDVINDPHDTSEAEEVKFVKVLMQSGRKKKEEQPEEEPDADTVEGTD